MALIEIGSEVDRFVLHFETPRKEINAYALATSLVGLSDAIREANSTINPGYQVEVVVEALEDGSFRAVVRTVFKQAKNLFSNEAVKAIVYGIIATYIYEHTIATKTPIQVTVSNDQVVIESGHEKIIVPKSVYDATKQVEKSERFKSSMGKVFEGARLAPDVSGVGIGPDDRQKKTPPLVPREKFPLFLPAQPQDELFREIVEPATLLISRAILQRGNRKWEFYWRGIRISAPVLDSRFYDRFFAHEITIAPGDALEVALRIIQEKDIDTGIFVNVRYEVIEVHSHIPRHKQQTLE